MDETLLTMNITDEDVTTGSASYANYDIRTRFINSSGAGVNAFVRNDLAFAASDPLSELVWSPQNGLSLIRASPIAADKKPLLLWNVGQSNTGPSPPPIIRPEVNQDVNVVDPGNTTVSQTLLDVDDIFVDRDTLLKSLGSREDVESNRKMEKEAGSEDAVRDEENLVDDRMEHCPSQNVQSAEISKEDADFEQQKEMQNEVTSAIRTVNENTIKMLGSTSENDSCNPTKKDENSPPVEGSQTESRICLYKEKGKEKALSDGDIYGKSLDDDEDDTHGSVESCNRARLLPRGVKRRSYGESLILGSKRMKKQVHYSSFLYWISNMVKGFADFSKEDCSSIPMPLACSSKVYAKNHHKNSMCNKGQDSAVGLQSLYCRDTNVLNTKMQKEDDSVEECREVMVDNKKPIENKQIITGNLAEIMVSDSLGEQMDMAAEKTSPEIPVSTSDVQRKSNPLTSLWITRFSNKNPRSAKYQEIIQEIDLNCQMNVVLPSRIFSSEASEAMTSVFSRRLDALRHIMPSENEAKDDHKLPLTSGTVFSLSELSHAIKNLRLSRADILRWMNSNVSLSRLNGFFLRLRLGNMKAGLESTGYYVACISGDDARELNGCTSKKSIVVDVGGIKSSVTSQYISNHDFLEDEIKAWWCRTVDSGRRIPSLDELNSKFNERKSLGF